MCQLILVLNGDFYLSFDNWQGIWNIQLISRPWDMAFGKIFQKIMESISCSHTTWPCYFDLIFLYWFDLKKKSVINSSHKLEHTINWSLLSAWRSDWFTWIENSATLFCNNLSIKSMTAFSCTFSSVFDVISHKEFNPFDESVINYILANE